MDVRLLLFLFAQILQSNCLDNLALNKSASQSSNLYDDKWLADEAVDGDGNQKLTGNSCACTSDNFFPAAWWQVNLGKVYAMSGVNIFYRSETGVANAFTFILSGFILYVNLNDDFLSTTPVYINNGGVQSNPGPPANSTVTLEAYGQYVTIYKQRRNTCIPRANPNFCALFELCEVEVLGCPQKKHGSDCQSDCPENCLYDVCKISDGKCFECKDGYDGEACDQPCTPGTYGAACSKTCSGNCKTGVPCDFTDGECPYGCSDGYLGSQCNITCDPGTFGASCSSSCGSCRESETCNFINGTCPTGCGLGVTGQYCKTACSTGTYDYDCKEICSGNCYNGVTCNVQTGRCDGGCAAGWRGDKCDTGCPIGTYGSSCVQSCSRNCLNEAACNTRDGSCQYGCQDGWTGNTCNQESDSGRQSEGDTKDNSGLQLQITINSVIGGVVITGMLIIVVILWMKIRKINKHVNENRYIQENTGGEKLGDTHGVREHKTGRQSVALLHTETQDNSSYEDLRPGGIEMNNYEALQENSEPSALQDHHKKCAQVPDTRAGRGGSASYEDLKDVRLNNMYESLKNTRDATYNNTQL